ncbi:hypothetical protein TCAL_00415 [Tigriopus californicus]|uniref:Tectonic-1-3 domain-containing protein n=1 Tax=Tigriopus californicus TaxID=6832 RepID=A0A553NB10_TIGCA|nr:hypothetical protein TCAL_00415 [Tigriopus californicus]
MTPQDQDEVESLALAIQSHYFQWRSINPIEPQLSQLSAEQAERLCGLVKPALFRSPTAEQFPVLPKHKREFLKRLILILEHSGMSEVDEVFYHEMAHPRPMERCYKSYFLQGQYLLSLVETEALVSRGTTGLQTWQAGVFLLSWLKDRQKSLWPDSRPSRVLELGSGVGYTGIGLLKLGLVQEMVLSDYHPDVLETLALNCRENVSESKGSKWSVESLDWTQFSESDVQALKPIDVIIAADVVFDPSLVPHLARTLGLLLRTTPVAYVACTPRNLDTLELFLSQIASQDLIWSESEISIPNPDHVKIYEMDRKAFSDCLVQLPLNPDDNYCYTTEIFYVNGTQFALGVSPNGVFCALSTELEDGLQFKEREILDNVTLFNKIKTRHEQFLWPKLDTNVNVRVDPSHYKVGEVIWIEQNGIVGKLTFPDSLNSRDCNAFRPVEFMTDTDISCTYFSLTPDTDCSQEPRLNLQTFTRAFKVVKNPNLYLNDTAKGRGLIDIEVQLCRSDGHKTSTCMQIQDQDPIPEPTSQCRNVLKSLHYEIIHNGVDGIEKITAFADLTDEVSHVRPTYVEQKFRADFFWSSDNLTSVQVRSGNPGYLDGKPLRTGLLKYDHELTAWVIDKFENPLESPVSLMPQSPDGSCIPAIGSKQRTPMNFRKNIRIGCSFHLEQQSISRECENLRRQTMDLLVGGSGVETLRESMVASFGNSESQFPGDWVPVIVSNAPSPPNQGNNNREERPGVCSNVVLGLHIEVVHSKTGSLANPQAKIIGVNYRFAPPQDVKIRCLGQSCQSVHQSQRLEVFTTVNFVDVSQEAEDRYAEFPVFEAKLPYDFFYPFVSQSVMSSTISHFLLPHGYYLPLCYSLHWFLSD